MDRSNRRIDLEIREDEIDMVKTNTAVSTSYNIVKSKELAPGASEEVLIYIKNVDDICGSIVKMKRKSYRDELKAKIKEDIKLIQDNIDGLEKEGSKDSRKLMLEMAMKNVLGSAIYELVQVNGQYKDYCIVKIAELLEE